ncbi:uncharacterized protein LOC134658747 [Cydia amplana]|uniref:uncharacterized protein LOC134656001 n=1 Tax=Cydia amplana TaxID=1869771 RepID=UPI002FE5DEFF
MAHTLKCNNCNIVVNELLAFVINKLHLMDDESMSRICLAFFTAQDIRTAKDLLFLSVPVRKRKINRRREGHQRRDIDDIIDLARETDPDKFPVFVARDLHKLPPIDFDSVDLTSLLKDMVVLKNELQAIKARYVTQEQFENLEKIAMECRRIPNESDLFYRNVSHSNLNVNVRRGAYLNSGPMGLHMSSRSIEYDDEDNKTLLSQSSPIGTGISPSHSSKRKPAERAEHTNSVSADQENTSAHALNLAPQPSPPRSSPPPSSAIATKQSPSKQVSCTGEQVETMTKNRLVSVPLVTESQELPNPVTLDPVMSFADIAKEGEWKKVVKRSKPAPKNRRVGMMGKADIKTNFKAADPKIPIMITNVHKDTSKADIINYIREKTSDVVTLEQIVMKNKNTNYNAYKFYVCQEKVSMFLDESLWPSGIIFRRFITSKHVLVNTGRDRDTAPSDTTRTSATPGPTSATPGATSAKTNLK